MKRILCCWWLAAAVCSAAAETPSIIIKSRQYEGGEEALSKVNSVHLAGTITTEIVGDAGSKRVGQIDIVFQRPMQECITTIEPDAIVRKGLDDYNGWQLEQDRGPHDPAKFDSKLPQSLTILGPADVRLLRADTWENLYYYRDITEFGGSVQDLGPVDMDGVHCERVRLVHSATIGYDRYIELSTGRVVCTVTSAGAQMRESGSQFVDGVRFAQSVTINEQSGGKSQKTVLEFKTVTLNETFPESLFETPLPALPIDPPLRTKAP
ncbi:MAG TPA: hypothetical protein VGL42_03190 [Opitutaceae bacterium]|jgi:hypothetical protein